MKDEPAHIVLCLMVANEEKIIERCLRSALSHVDAVVVCWNGTDETVDIARELLCRTERIVDFHFEHHAWVNFGHNRTLSARAAKRWVEACHPDWPLESTYLLFMDADMELVVDRGFGRDLLTAPGYNLIQVNHGEEYYNLRLARLSHDWRSVGVTHEYWAATPDIGEPARLWKRDDPRGLMWLRDLDDGGSKSDKTERDIRLLEQGLVDEPGNVRYMFYLARAYADSGQHAKAVPLYRQRQVAGGWDQETWYAHYREGLSLLSLGKETEGIGVLLQAYQERPTRAEPLAFLAQYHRERGRNHLALMFARQASKMPAPDDSLFIWADAHRGLPLREIAITAYYTGEHEEGIAAAEKLIGDRSCDAHTQTHMLQTLSFYVKPLLPKAVKMGAYSVPESLRTAPEKSLLALGVPSTVEYVGKNPATVVYRGAYTNISLVNYYHERGVVFAPKDDDGIVRTRNIVLSEDGARETTPDQWPDGWIPDVRIRGLEDQRWVVFDDRIWFTATCFHPHGRAEVVLGRLSENVDRVEFLTTLQFAGAGACEKNWVPFVDHGRLLLVYGFEPFIVLGVCPTTGDCELVSFTLAPVNASSWRGGTPPVIAYWGALVMLVHVVAHFDDRRVYMHRWVELAVYHDQFRISRWSNLFAIDHVGVEYATGLLDKGETVLVAYGSEEKEARWIEFAWKTVDDMLRDRK
jgi:glycosyltransferase involved in cell wall biosynthesis